MTFIWNIQVNLWGIVDGNNESFMKVFLRCLDKGEAVRKRCRGRVIRSELEHSRYLSFDRSEKWRQCWSIWCSGNDTSFFASRRCKFQVESWCKIKFPFGFGLIDHWFPMSSFQVGYYYSRNLRCHRFDVPNVIIGSFSFDTLEEFLPRHFQNMWPVPTMLP